MNWAAAGRKIRESSALEVAHRAVAKTGTDAVVSVTIPA